MTVSGVGLSGSLTDLGGVALYRVLAVYLFLVMLKMAMAKRLPHNKTMRKLTLKELRFVSEYLACMNPVTAAKKAGYSAPMGKKLLENPIIAKMIAYEDQKTCEKLELSREEILLQLYYCVTRSVSDFCDAEGKIITDVRHLSERARNTIDGIEQDVYWDSEGNQHLKTKIKLVPKATALDMAMKHKGLFAPQQIDLAASNRPVLDWSKLYGKPDGVEQPDEVGDV